MRKTHGQKSTDRGYHPGESRHAGPLPVPKVARRDLVATVTAFVTVGPSSSADDKTFGCTRDGSHSQWFPDCGFFKTTLRLPTRLCATTCKHRKKPTVRTALTVATISRTSDLARQLWARLELFESSAANRFARCDRPHQRVATVSGFLTVGSSFRAKPNWYCPHDNVKPRREYLTWEEPTVRKALTVATTNPLADKSDCRRLAAVGYAR